MTSNIVQAKKTECIPDYSLLPPEIVTNILERSDVATQALVSMICKKWQQLTLMPTLPFGKLSAIRQMAVVKPSICQLYSSSDKSDIVFHSASEQYILFAHKSATQLQLIEKKSSKIKLIDLVDALGENEKKLQSLAKQTIMAATLSPQQNVMIVSQQGTIAQWEADREGFVCKKHIQIMNREGMDNEKFLLKRVLFGTNTIFVRREKKGIIDSVEAWDFDQGLRHVEMECHWGGGPKLHAVHSNNFYDIYFDQNYNCFLRKFQVDKENGGFAIQQTQFQEFGFPSIVVCANKKWVITAHDIPNSASCFYTVSDAKDLKVQATIQVSKFSSQEFGIRPCWLFDDLFVYSTRFSVDLFYIPTQSCFPPILLELDVIKEIQTTGKSPLLHVEMYNDNIYMLLQRSQGDGLQLQQVEYKHNNEVSPRAVRHAKSINQSPNVCFEIFKTLFELFEQLFKKIGECF